MAIFHPKSNTNADWTGTVTVFNSAGSTVTAAATNLVRATDWNNAHNQLYTLEGNTAINSTASGTNVVFKAAGNITLAGSTGSIVISGQPHVSSLVVNEGILSHAVASVLNQASISAAAAFFVPVPISMDFLRIPAIIGGASTGLSTAGQTLNASAFKRSTFNAVIYSLGTGASSKSLMSVLSGSMGASMSYSISADTACSISYSVTQGFTIGALGTATITGSTQYSTASSIYVVANQLSSIYSGVRGLDIPMAASLSAGPYWLIFGVSSSSASNSARFSAATAAGPSLGGFFGRSVPLSGMIGVMGSTNVSSGGGFGAGSFSTAGGGTTAALAFSAITALSFTGTQLGIALNFQMLGANFAA